MSITVETFIINISVETKFDPLTAQFATVIILQQ